MMDAALTLRTRTEKQNQNPVSSVRLLSGIFVTARRKATHTLTPYISLVHVEPVHNGWQELV